LPGVLGFSESHAEAEVALDERHRRSVNALNDMLREEARRAGASSAEINAAFAADYERRDVIEQKRVSFVGWLVTNWQFRDEVHSLRTAWDDQIRILRRFPRFPQWPFRDLGVEANVSEDFAGDFLYLYSR
jgi:hypothetical protein